MYVHKLKLYILLCSDVKVAVYTRTVSLKRDCLRIHVRARAYAAAFLRMRSFPLRAMYTRARVVRCFGDK